MPRGWPSSRRLRSRIIPCLKSQELDLRKRVSHPQNRISHRGLGSREDPIFVPAADDEIGHAVVKHGDASPTRLQEIVIVETRAGSGAADVGNALVETARRSPF